MDNSITKERKFKPLELFETNNVVRLFLLLMLLLLFAGMTKGSKFYSINTFQSIGLQLAEYGLMALGVSVCMISGGIDLSTVSMANLSGICAALVMQNVTGQFSIPIVLFVGVIISLLVGTLCGALNGILITKLKIPPMLATLGTFQLFMGIGIVLSNGSAVGGIPNEFTYISRSMIAVYIPLPLVIFLVISIILAFFMKNAKYGRRTYLVGTSEKSAKFAGIKNHNILIRTYMISGILSSIAGILTLAKVTSAKADFGSSYTMLCILICVLGGLNPNGGFGTVGGVSIAVIILQVISSLLTMFPNVSNYFRDLIWGIALILVLILNLYFEKKSQKKLLQAANENEKIENDSEKSVTDE